MEPLDHGALSTADLEAALTAEAAYDRVWLPPEPWWDPVVTAKAAISESLLTQLRRGVRWPVGDVVDVRKPGHGIRPVAVLPPEVRVAYRALATAAIPPDERPDRSADSYADFVVRPVREAYPGTTGPRRVGSAKYSHIVVTDIAAFYQYIDHQVLLSELDLMQTPIDISDALVGLLGDIEGRSFGIPQICDPSDWLSESYATRIERSLVRDGFDVWRYSDDFRIGCVSYSDALRAIESASKAARDAGLVLNERKTTVLTFFHYLVTNSDAQVRDASAELDPADVEAAVTVDYAPDDVDAEVQAAEEVFARLVSAPGQQGNETWSLRNLNSDQHRAVRRALNTLTKHGHPAAVRLIPDLLTFQPAMTHRVVRYMQELHSAVADAASLDRFRWIIENLSLNEWQRSWIAYGVRACDVDVAGDAVMKHWLEAQMDNRQYSLAAAEAAVTLATFDSLDPATLEDRMREARPPMQPWYFHAMRLLADHGSAPPQLVNALRGESAISKAILA